MTRSSIPCHMFKKKIRDVTTLDNNNNQFIFHTIKSSAIKKFVIIDLITGTGIYWTVNFISSSALLAIISCVLGTKKIKKMQQS